MTHEELLHEIDHHWAGSLESGKKSWLALGAVARLHQPGTLFDSKGDKHEVCLVCWRSEASRYPCATIKAIEAEIAPHSFPVNLDEVWIDRQTGKGHCGDSCACGNGGS